MASAPSASFGDDDASFDETLEDHVKAEKTRALQEPGMSWRTWALHRLLRGYYLLAILILDVSLLVFWIQAGSWVGFVLSVAGALYLEFLFYRFLWYRPHPDSQHRWKFRRTWFRPVPYGRWTPEAQLAKAGAEVPQTTEGPNPKEFL